MTKQLDLYDLRRREVQALGAALSCRDWYMMEKAYNSLRDKLDNAGFTVSGPPASPKPPAGGDAGAVERAYRQGQIDMRDRVAAVCDERGAEEQEGYGLNRAAQNYFRARNAVRVLEPAALALPAPVVEGDAADARRYRYLRDHCSYHQAMTWQQPAEWSIGWEFQQVTPDQAFGSFDRWIDEDIERQLLADAEDTEDADAPAALSEGRSHG